MVIIKPPVVIINGKEFVVVTGTTSQPIMTQKEAQALTSGKSLTTSE
jgi:hypothetical protein